MRKYDDLLVMLLAAVATILSMLCIALLNGCSIFTVDPQPTQNTTCEAVEAHINAVGCVDMLLVPGADEMPYTADDVPWDMYCRTIQSSGIVELDLDCAISVNTCPQIERCFNND